MPVIRNFGISHEKTDAGWYTVPHTFTAWVAAENAKKVDYLYVFALGEQPNPGYGLEIARTEMSWEQAKVYIRLTKPEPGKMYAAVLSYPYLVGKMNLPKYTTISVIIEDTGEVL